MTQFASLTYYSFNAPAYYGGVILLTMFGIFYIMLYLALQYETYNKANYCKRLMRKPATTISVLLVLAKPQL